MTHDELLQLLPLLKERLGVEHYFGEENGVPYVGSRVRLITDSSYALVHDVRTSYHVETDVNNRVASS